MIITETMQLFVHGIFAEAAPRQMRTVKCEMRSLSSHLTPAARLYASLSFSPADATTPLRRSRGAGGSAPS